MPESEDSLELTEVCEFAFIGKEPCFYKNLRYFYDKEFYKNNKRQLLSENDFTLFSSGNNLNLPTPFRNGDILHVDCRPFAPKASVTVTDNQSEYDCCYISGFKNKIVVAFVSANTKGTRNTISLAKRANIRIIEKEYNGREII